MNVWVGTVFRREINIKISLLGIPNESSHSQPLYLAGAARMTSVYSNDYQKVIKSLREARINNRITQEELASAFSRPQSFVAKVESGERRLDVVEFIRYCRVVNVDPASILEKL